MQWGDHAPKAIIDGVQKSLTAFSDIEITLVGDENKIKPYITNNDRITILDAKEVIEPTDEPVRAVRRKRIHLW